MSDIVLSKGIRNNLLQLQNTADKVALTQGRLSTGKKVNSALDNPTNFFTAAALNSRANDLSNLLDGLQSGIKVIEAADNGLKAITRTIESLQSTVRQARQDKTFKTASYTLGVTASPNTATTPKQISFSSGAIGTTPITVDLETLGTAGTKSSLALSSPYTAPAAGTQSTFAPGGSTILGDGTSTADFTVQLGSGTAFDVSLTSGDNSTTLADLITNINADIATSATAQSTTADVEAFDNGGSIGFRSLSGSADTITIGGTDAASVSDSGTATAGTANDPDVTFTVTDSAGTVKNITISRTAIDAAAGADDNAKTINVINAQLSAGTASLVNAVADGTNGFSLENIADGTNTFSVSGATGVSFAAGTATAGTASGAGAVKTIDQLVADINNTTALKDKIRASSDNGKLRIENLSTLDLDIGGIASGSLTGATTITTSAIGPNEVRKNLVTQFNDLRNQLDKFSDDASFNGINLLKGDKLKLFLNENSTSTIEIQAKDNLGNVREITNTQLGIIEATKAEFESDSALDARLDALKASLDTIRSQSSSFGSNLSIVENRQDFTKNTINTLKTGADNLTLADMNEEAANLLSLQTRQQLSQTALSLANQADQGVLRLFG